MKELVVPPLIINIFMFIIGLVMGINPSLVTVSAPGGYVFQISFSAIVGSLIAVGIAIAFVGINVLGSGLSDTSVAIINKCIVYFMVWTLLSTITAGFLSLIPMFGLIIYGVLTLLYAFGVFLSVGDMESAPTTQEVSGGGE